MEMKKMPVRKTRPAPKKKRKRSSSSIVDRIVPVQQVKENLVMLAYGRSGTGKTHFGSTFPRPSLFLDIKERGTATIANEPDIDLAQIVDWGEFEDLYWELKKGMKYKSIIIDQITNLQDMGMDDVRARSRKTSKELFTQRNWGQLGGQLKEWITNFRGMADMYHILFIAHQRTFGGGDEEDNALDPVVGARVMPSIGSFLDGAVDAIGSTFVREEEIKKGNKTERVVEYCMRIGPHAYYLTKVRRPVEAGPVPGFIVNPTYQKIIDLELGKSTKRKVRRRN
jgi:hypothetical protein